MVNREARKKRFFSSEQKGEGGGNSNCRWGGILIVADQPTSVGKIGVAQTDLLPLASAT